MDSRLVLVLLSFLAAASSQDENGKQRSFKIDYNNSQFLMDGKPFRYISGEMHYFRVPRVYWKDRLHKMKAAGLNAVSTYIEWSSHETTPNVYLFSGEQDLVHYIKTAQEVGLYVILRPGPYICAEREFGGYPAWLLTINPNVKLRTSDPSHTFFITRWFRHLMPKIVPLLYGNGGPVIMVQVENEYGSYPINDQNYLNWLRDLYRSYVKDAAVLFTTDGAGLSYIARGRINGVFSTIDFGPSTVKVNATFAPLRKIQPKGPLVNSEFYVGWLSYWGQPFATVAIPPILSTMEDMLVNNVSFNMYMFHGGTNFGFTSGSGSDKTFQADLTSYDYDAPVSEAGDLTHKYYAIQNLLSKYFPTEKIKPAMEEKSSYGEVNLEPIISLFDSPTRKDPISSENPLTFEQLGQKYGFVNYEATVVTSPKDPSVFQANVRDRGIVYLNKEEVSVLQYTVINETPLPPTLEDGQRLMLLVENMGRRNFKLLSDCTKGLISNATIDGVTVKDWKITGYPLTTEDIVKIEQLKKDKQAKLPAFFSGQFQLGEGEAPKDTYLDTSNWGKGVAFINGFNLGRYWHLGPQVTLYVPGYLLNKFPANNTLTLLELHYTSMNNTISFVSNPHLNKTIS